MFTQGDLLLVELDYILAKDLKYLVMIFDSLQGEKNEFLQGVEPWISNQFFDIFIEFKSAKKLSLSEISSLKNFNSLFARDLIIEYFENQPIESLLTHKICALREFAKKELKMK